MWNNVKIIDISQPIQNDTAVFPGDQPFYFNPTIHHAESGIINLTAFTMSPHVGTHADAPIHITGDLSSSLDTIGHQPLTPYIGPCYVINVAPHTGIITWNDIEPYWPISTTEPHTRVLFKTRKTLRYNVFETNYAALCPHLIPQLHQRGVVLVGLDTPSVDPTDSKTLDTHHALRQHQMVWLENLDLTDTDDGIYTLVALPLKFTTLEASPVRAILLKTAESNK